MSAQATVLLHGWGTHPVIWEPLRDHLPHARALPLPGYAGTAMAQTLDGAALQLAAQIEAGTTLVGWSLGGLVAMRLALACPEKISRLVLIGATPCFVTRPDWAHGVAGEVFDAFSASLAVDYAGTIRRFLSLQAQGSHEMRTVLAELRKRLLAEPRPAAGVLEGGLTLLRDADLRHEVGRLTVPLSLIHGVGDRLAPVAAARWLQQAVGGVRLDEIPGAGHAPFLSHAAEVARMIGDG
jgi:pimeloyl-[acyl-carrier protein] methyl ester esterase